MNTPETLSSKNIILKNWDNLDDNTKNTLMKVWRVLTYKWQLQISFNLPFLVWWLLDAKIDQVHQFDLKVISYLNLPEWTLSLIGFGQFTF